MIKFASIPSSISSSIPSPSQGVWHLGPIPLRGYALCILIGIGVAILVGQRRWKARGGDPVVVVDVATWAVPFGVIGGRIYHVITSPSEYFGAGGDPVKALYVWQGGLGIWGAVVLGGVGAWIGCRRSGVKLPPYADSIAPGIVLAQAIGRWGNWFNNELYGRPTNLPWGLQIHEWDSSSGEAVRDAAGHPVVQGVYQPFFLYESIWDVITAIVLVVADRRWKLGHGRVFALYVVVYSAGRGALEPLRIDQADHILGVRLNVWTSIIVFLGGLTYLYVSARLRPGREADLYRPGFDPAASTQATSTPVEPVSSNSTVSTADTLKTAGPEGPDSAEDPDTSIRSDGEKLSVTSDSSPAGGAGDHVPAPPRGET
jgi:prolipoprotein diacylglyceryl transferase